MMREKRVRTKEEMETRPTDKCGACGQAFGTHVDNGHVFRVVEGSSPLIIELALGERTEQQRIQCFMESVYSLRTGYPNRKFQFVPVAGEITDGRITFASWLLVEEPEPPK